MDLQLLLVTTLFSVLFAESHAALSPKAYWISVLPNTEMPKAITNLLKPETTMGVGKGGVGVSRKVGQRNYELAASGIKPRGYKNYIFAASATQMHYSEIEAIFFLETDLKIGKSMSVDLTNSDGGVTFLPRSDAEKIPFSSEKISNVFSLYDVKAESMEGQMMMETVKECETPAMKGEEKYCATSLESMVDFSTSILGKHVRAISTEVDKETKLQKYTITGTSKVKGSETVVCHKELYPYTVFHCHDTYKTRTYTTSLVGTDGTKATAVAICHTDTSTWNPRHLSFLMLKVKPGTVPICHFLQENNIVWVGIK